MGASSTGRPLALRHARRSPRGTVVPAPVGTLEWEALVAVSVWRLIVTGAILAGLLLLWGIMALAYWFR